MANTHELARGNARLRALIEFALGEGWHVKRTRGGHLMFTKPGCAAIYTSSTAGGVGQNLEPSRRGLWGEINAIARGIPTQIFVGEISGIQRQFAPERKRSFVVSATTNVHDEASPPLSQ